ncbi:hypothetical protein GH714_037605 [Hevea brasiliensis]|uniref:PORR domain-containing protein n=1 Tax=Hevea brasiliensis TaxID=3981 RepID=A0A6A6KA96_HEVBR|nr:hypothetical protein GH714_037605 [Hevea brasiliensis]
MVTQIVKAEALMNGFDKANLFAFLPMRTKWYGKPLLGWMQSRFMTTSKRVQDRSSKKRVHDLEIVTEKWKIVSKVMAVMEVLKQEVEMDQRGVLWCGMTKEAEDLLEEQERLIEEHSDKAAEYVTRCLMMSVDKQLRVDKIAHFRRDFGLPMDFRTKWVHKYSKLFRVVKSGGGEEYLKLVSWKPAWEITELEKKILGATEISVHEPGLLSLPFPLKFPPNYKKLVYRYGGKIDHFQKRSYISPYADARGLTAGSLEFDKRAVAIMHELLSFTIEKRLVTDHLTHFRREFVMPQKLMRLLLKHFGIFYVSERGKRFSVFLNEAYEGQELIEKGPLVVWKEKLLSLVGYRGKKKKIETSSDLSDMEYDNFIDNDSEKECMSMQLECEETMGDIEGALLVDNDEMEVGELGSAYKDIDTS